jgi:glycosyltransferase involved in cell wall biosynthesis
VLGQTRPADEILVQDGGSTDKTLVILEQYGEAVLVQSMPDTGQSQALNRALDRATGDLVGWLNADDIYYPETLAFLERKHSEYPEADIYFGDFTIIDNEDVVLRRFRLPEWRWQRALWGPFPFFSGAAFFRQSVFEAHGGFDEQLHYCMDLELMLRIGANAMTVHIPEVLGALRVYGESKTGGSPRGFLKEGFRLRLRYSSGIYVRSRVLVWTLLETIYLYLRKIRWSRLWSSLRKEHRL